MEYIIQEEKGFKYIEEGKGDVLLLLHGLMGALSNWEKVIEEFSGVSCAHSSNNVFPSEPLFKMIL